MNAKLKRLRPEFRPETRFELKPAPAVSFRAVQDSRFEYLKRQLLSERLAETAAPEFNSQVRRAANEAAALAWVTPYPLLVFPVLFEEKTAEAVRVFERQAQVRRRSRELLAL